MPYTTAVAGTVITAAYANANIRDQVVTPFASPAARDSAIGTPVAGMVEYLTSNDKDEGLTTRTSANTWRLPWNMPWGFVAETVTTTASAAITTTETVAMSSAGFTSVANRRYLVEFEVPTIGTVVSDLFNASIRYTSASGTLFNVVRFPTVGGSIQQTVRVSAIVTGLLAASGQVMVLTFQRAAGTGSIQTLAGINAICRIYDLGPTGAPS